MKKRIPLFVSLVLIGLIFVLAGIDQIKFIKMDVELLYLIVGAILIPYGLNELITKEDTAFKYNSVLSISAGLFLVLLYFDGIKFFVALGITLIIAAILFLFKKNK